MSLFGLAIVVISGVLAHEAPTAADRFVAFAAPNSETVDGSSAEPVGAESATSSTTEADLAAAVETAELDNGDIVAVVTDHRVPVVTLHLSFPVSYGSAWSLEHDAGLAWSVQSNDPDGALRERANDLAVDMLFYQSWDGAHVRLDALTEDLPAAMELVSDVFASTEVDPAELRRRLRSRRYSDRLNRKDPEWQRTRVTAQTMYPKGHRARHRFDVPYRPDMNPERLLATRDAMVITPGRVLGFAGDITLDEAVDLVDGWLPPASEGPDNTLDWGELNPTPASEVVEQMPRLTQHYLAMSRDGVPIDDPDYPAFMLANHILGGHFHARLYMALRHEGGLTYGVSANGGGWIRPTTYQITTFTKSQTGAEIEARLREVVDTFRQGVTADELAAAKTNLAGRRAFEQQSPSSPLNRWLYEVQLGIGVGTVDAAKQTALGLSLEEVNAFIERWFVVDAFTMVRVVPRGSGD